MYLHIKVASFPHAPQSPIHLVYSCQFWSRAPDDFLHRPSRARIKFFSSVRFTYKIYYPLLLPSFFLPHAIAPRWGSISFAPPPAHVHVHCSPLPPNSGMKLSWRTSGNQGMYVYMYVWMDGWMDGWMLMCSSPQPGCWVVI